MRIKFRLFRHGYTLDIRPFSNYCGAYSNALKSLPGEDWIRGNDLLDGSLWKLPSVLIDILSCEFRLRWTWHYKVDDFIDNIIRKILNKKLNEKEIPQ